MEFPKMRRFKQALSEQECFDILTKEKRATLAVSSPDYPYALPINFYFDKEDKAIYFHSAKAGRKAELIAADPRVCFTVVEQGEQREDWSYYVRSVIVFGRATLVEEGEKKLAKTKRFGMKYYPSEAEVDVEIAKDFPRMDLYQIQIDHISGKLVHEK